MDRDFYSLPENYPSGLSEAHGEVACNNLMGHSLMRVPFSLSIKDILLFKMLS
jgi:hypothetical protein